MYAMPNEMCAPILLLRCPLCDANDILIATDEVSDDRIGPHVLFVLSGPVNKSLCSFVPGQYVFTVRSLEAPRSGSLETTTAARVSPNRMYSTMISLRPLFSALRPDHP